MHNRHGEVLARVRSALYRLPITFISPAVHQPGAPEAIRILPMVCDTSAAALHRGSDLGVEPVDPLAQVIDIYGVDGHLIFLAVGGVWSYRRFGLTQQTSPDPMYPRGPLEAVGHHGHRWPVPVEKSTAH